MRFLTKNVSVEYQIENDWFIKHCCRNFNHSQCQLKGIDTRIQSQLGLSTDLQRQDKNSYKPHFDYRCNVSISLRCSLSYATQPYTSYTHDPLKTLVLRVLLITYIRTYSSDPYSWWNRWYIYRHVWRLQHEAKCRPADRQTAQTASDTASSTRRNPSPLAPLV